MEEERFRIFLMLVAASLDKPSGWISINFGNFILLIILDALIKTTLVSKRIRISGLYLEIRSLPGYRSFFFHLLLHSS